MSASESHMCNAYVELHDAVVHSARIRGQCVLVEISHASAFFAEDGSRNSFHVWSHRALLGIWCEGEVASLPEGTISDVEGLPNVVDVSDGSRDEVFSPPVVIKFSFESGNECSFRAKGFRLVLGQRGEWLEKWEGILR